MTLLPLPDYRRRRILVGGSVRKDLPTLKAHLESLDWQEKPKQTDFHFAFVADWPQKGSDAETYLRDWVKFRQGEILRGAPPVAGDFAEGPGLDSHQWSVSAMQRVAHNKNVLIRRALEIGADAIWYVDSDLVLDRTTFASLDAAEKPITTAVFWTRWSKRQTETQRQYALPQVWLTHPYGLAGRGFDDAEFRGKLINRELTQVWGFGACSLLNRKVLEAGVDFSYLPDLPKEGMWMGEDRHLAVKAERLHIPAYADPWPDIFHCYHAEDVAKLGPMVERLGAAHPDRAGVGDLVSLRLRALEPLPVAPGRFQQVAPQIVRGRVGAIKLAPDLEAAVLSMKRGEKHTVRVHFDISHPQPFYRGKIRLIDVTLLDVKPWRPAPVIEEDLWLGRDRAALTPEQEESLAEVAGVP